MLMDLTGLGSWMITHIQSYMNYNSTNNHIFNGLLLVNYFCVHEIIEMTIFPTSCTTRKTRILIKMQQVCYATEMLNSSQITGH